MFKIFGKKKKGNDGSSTHPTDFEGLVEKGTHHTQALHAAHEGGWGFGRADRFEVDLESNRIQFIFEGDKIASAPLTLIGTWAAASSEFLWGWDHPMCPPADNAAAVAVKAYADAHNIVQLQQRTVSCAGDDGWPLAGIACLLGDLQGVYRTPNGDNLVYFGFGNITLRSIA
ncbi:hypothetical protein GCM10011309_13510 [Litorimonas cladophorae]|uniref:Uncharacterized protein n=1 Tax=Litorimonas cladophorae TaxID=1220491 RepID=A0A918KIF6_9PROT|nr:DUF6882 domain-containing protein [Litorimonas cladophorae]GGX64601.1 hypothetical protein GCM10011309_13510 [Litorimonas cladophorae]